jgi:DNA invertase Pin-like site-specific DNA recombinase
VSHGGHTLSAKEEKRAGLYVRVSTNEQSTEAQEAELKQYAARRAWSVRVYADKGISGAKAKRPALDQLMADCRKGTIDVVLVWKFDRFARSLKQLVSALEEFNALRIDFVSCTEAIDTSIPTGELVFQIFGAIAQFERSLISERVRAGIAFARQQGRRIGRKPLKELSQFDAEKIKAERAANGVSIRKLARMFGTTEYSMSKVLAGQNAGT